jgi:hypothetical protein
MIGVLGEAGKGFHLPLEGRFSCAAHVCPRRGSRLGRGVSFVSGHHAQRLLAGERLLAQLVPAPVELPL